MSPVDESVHMMIIDEFVKDKEQLAHFRKEKSQCEITETYSMNKNLFINFNLNRKTDNPRYPSLTDQLLEIKRIEIQ